MPEDTVAGRRFFVGILGHLDREHPIEDALIEAVGGIADFHGFDADISSGPLYSGGDETDRKLAEVTAERDRLRELTAACICAMWPPEGPSAECPIHGAIRAFNEASHEVLAE